MPIAIKLLTIDTCFKVSETKDETYSPARISSSALDKMWHEDCLKCACCDCRLGETGSTLYLKANLILCKRDYLRLFGMTGHCASCQRLSKTIDRRRISPFDSSSLQFQPSISSCVVANWSTISTAFPVPNVNRSAFLER